MSAVRRRSWEPRVLDDSLVVRGPIHAWRAHWLRLAQQTLAGTAHRSAVRLALRQGFVLTWGQTRDAGLTAATVRALLRRGQWSSPRRGVLSVLAADGEDALAIDIAAAMLARPGCVAVGRSAAVLQGLPLYALPARPTLLAPQRHAAGGRTDVVVRTGSLPPDQMDTWFGVPLSGLVRTVVDLAREDRRDGLIAADAALNEGLVGSIELAACCASVAGRQGARTARFVADFATDRSESPLETLTRLLLHDHGIPLPTPQVWIDTAGGTYRVDGLWAEQRVVLEVDGMLKYGGGGRALVAEKRRQEQLERAGYRVVRVTWDDVVNDPAGTAARIRWALGLGTTAR